MLIVWMPCFSQNCIKVLGSGHANIGPVYLFVEFTLEEKKETNQKIKQENYDTNVRQDLPVNFVLSDSS